ncbi:MerR family transcriptional regulator [Bremerella sp. T1]|uniref:MerR family DNA-binding transcriptional regulator n=1 Tax=Bremerella sp. TYQ1 TaxID=3119568 RepID=UPI001CCF3755|nr:MerR family DNA-binding transcriptional regulator [Bremerella volcania]UBM33748.1 MerR family DNA-binding transcriptional regulator [Bremerella volcania]
MSQTTLRKYAEAGKFSMRRNPVNGYRLFRRGDLESLLKQIVEPTQKPRAKKG